ncbi:MAG: hypothetical protein AABX33_04940 [Nanoarchaeota archaeon]
MKMITLLCVIFGGLTAVLRYFGFIKLSNISGGLFFLTLIVVTYKHLSEFRDKLAKSRLETAKGDTKDFKNWISKEKHYLMNYTPLISVSIFYFSVLVLGVFLYIPIIFLVIALTTVFKKDPYLAIALSTFSLFLMIPIFRMFTYTKYLIIRRFDITVYYTKQIIKETNEEKLKKLQGWLIHHLKKLPYQWVIMEYDERNRLYFTSIYLEEILKIPNLTSKSKKEIFGILDKGLGNQNPKQLIYSNNLIHEYLQKNYNKEYHILCDYFKKKYKMEEFDLNTFFNNISQMRNFWKKKIFAKAYVLFENNFKWVIIILLLLALIILKLLGVTIPYENSIIAYLSKL